MTRSALHFPAPTNTGSGQRTGAGRNRQGELLRTNHIGMEQGTGHEETLEKQIVLSRVKAIDVRYHCVASLGEVESVSSLETNMFLNMDFNS